VIDASTHQVVSSDGTRLIARVHGDGPPLLMLPAGPGDAETSWRHVFPLLQDHFTCYLVDTRGRGLSNDSHDHTPERLVDDVTVFAASIGGQVGLVEWGTALWARVAAAARSQFTAAAAYETGANQAMDDHVATTITSALERVGELVANARLTDAVEALLAQAPAIYNDAEMASGAPADFWHASAALIPGFLEEQRLATQYEPADPTDPALLGRITVPVLLLCGSESRPWFQRSTAYLAEHLPRASICEIAGAGHFGPYLNARAVADELVRFFGNTIEAQSTP
jgi:pimeloyl-ACP methyl ester carboxylesterase